MTAALTALGCLGLGFCAGSDAAQLAGKAWLRTVLFALGCVLQLAGGAGLLLCSRFWQGSFTAVRTAGFLLAAAGLALLLYTLFFSLPPDTYHQNSAQAVTTGVWAFCRHPGVWWYFFCLAGLALFAGETFWPACLLWSGLDLAYAAWQDAVVFPRTLSGYDNYCSSTPFMLPRFPRR